MRDSSVHPVSDASTPGSESPQLATNDQPVAHTRATRVRAEKAWMPDAAAHPGFDASTLRSQSPQLAAPRPTSCPHVRSTRESQGVGVSGAESVRCAALCSGGSGTFEMRACAAVQAGTTTRITGYRSNRQRSSACNTLRMDRCDRLPPPPSAATGKATPYGGEECPVGNA